MNFLLGYLVGFFTPIVIVAIAAHLDHLHYKKNEDTCNNAFRRR